MVGKKPWSDEDNKRLLGMLEEGLSLQEIVDSGLLPEPTLIAITLQAQRLGAVPKAKSGCPALTEAIEPAGEVMSMEQVVKLFSSAFSGICASKELDKYVLERFRIVFQAARDYGPLLAHYEKWDKIEKRIDELSAAVEELRSQKPFEGLPSRSSSLEVREIGGPGVGGA